MVIWKCFQISIKYRENKNCSKYEHMLHMMEKKVWRHSKNPRFLHLGSISCPVFSGRCKSHFMGNLRTDSAGDLNLRTKCFFFSSSELNKSNMCGSIVLCCTCAYVDSILWRGRGKPYHCVGLCWPLLPTCCLTNTSTEIDKQQVDYSSQPLHYLLMLYAA